MRKGHVLLAVARGRGRGARRSRDVQQQRRDAQAQGRADRLRAGAAGGRAAAGDRRRPQRSATQTRRALFADFVLSPEGQKLFESMGRVPASTRIKSEFNDFQFTVIDPVTVLDEAAKWDMQWNDLFVRR